MRIHNTDHLELLADINPYLFVEGKDGSLWWVERGPIGVTYRKLHGNETTPVSIHDCLPGTLVGPQQKHEPRIMTVLDTSACVQDPCPEHGNTGCPTLESVVCGGCSTYLPEVGRDLAPSWEEAERWEHRTPAQERAYDKTRAAAVRLAKTFTGDPKALALEVVDLVLKAGWAPPKAD